MACDDRALRGLYFDVVERFGKCSSRANWENYLRYLFDEVSFDQAAVLDIGAGIGLIGLYAACTGARRVVCLEPEAAGSNAGMTEEFEHLRAAIGMDDRGALCHEPFQTYDAKGVAYDVLVLHNSINHLDEEACTRLKHDASARDSYRRLFEKLSDLARPGGWLIITDCSRYNLFGLLGRRSPFAPLITWRLHQSPSFWAGMLSQAGFGTSRIRWTSFNRLGSVGRFFLGNAVVAYLTTSRFCLTMRKVSSPTGI